MNYQTVATRAVTRAKYDEGLADQPEKCLERAREIVRSEDLPEADRAAVLRLLEP